MMPALPRLNAMPVRSLAPREQEIERGADGSPVRIEGRIAKRLAIMPALGMRPELEPRDDIRGGGGRGRRHQDLFLRSRNSPNTSAALLPFNRTAAATDGSSARRNTLAFFSSPSSVGIVGLPAARSRLTSSARALSAGLSGSIPSANLTLPAVYSCPQYSLKSSGRARSFNSDSHIIG